MFVVHRIKYSSSRSKVFFTGHKFFFPIKEYKQSIYANMAALPLSTMAIKSRRSSSSSTDRQLAPTKLEE
jgi:hypothetical protein